MKVKHLAPSLLVAGLLAASSVAGPAIDESSGEPLKVSSGNIEAVLASDKLVLIDFWAEWCGPCQLIAPHIESIAKKYKGQVLVCKVDVDQNEELAKRYQIQGIPNLKLIQGGKVVDEILGYADEAAIAKKLDARLAEAN